MLGLCALLRGGLAPSNVNEGLSVETKVTLNAWSSQWCKINAAVAAQGAPLLAKPSLGPNLTAA